MRTIHPMPASGIGRSSRQLLTGPTKQEDAKTALPGRALVRPLGRITMVGALALFLVGAVATPAWAMKRSQTVKLVNGLIDLCFSAGGDPYVGEKVADGGFNFYCYWEDGSYTYGWWDYEPEDDGDAPVRGRSELRSASVAAAITADDTENGTADAEDQRRQKAHKQHKHKARADQHGRKHRR